MTTDDMEIVSTLQNAIVDRVGQDRYDLWFGANTRLALSDADSPAPKLQIAVPNRFFQDWLRNNFRTEVESCCEATLGKLVTVEFLVDEDLAAVVTEKSVNVDRSDNANSPDDTVKASTGPATLAFDAAEKKRSTAANGSGSSARAMGSPVKATMRRRYASLPEFVEGPENRLAYATAQMVVENPGRLSPLVLHGPTGVGKTHLLEGIMAASAARGLTSIYMSAEQFTSSFLEALHSSGMPNFRRKYRGVDVLVIDDIQFFAGKSSTLGEVLHTIDTLTRSGKQIVFSCDRAPQDLPELGAELTARLSGGMVCKLESPEFDTRRQILSVMLARQGWELCETVQGLIARKFTQHTREMLGAINRLRATSMAWGREVDLEFAEQMLADLAPVAQRQINLVDIERAVCDVFGVNGGALKSDKRAKRFSQPRMLAMWLARKYTRSALSEICDYFGRKSHATVISAEKRVNRWRADGEQIDLADHCWNADDAIRRVEERLRQA